MIFGELRKCISDDQRLDLSFWTESEDNDDTYRESRYNERLYETSVSDLPEDWYGNDYEVCFIGTEGSSKLSIGLYDFS